VRGRSNVQMSGVLILPFLCLVPFNARDMVWRASGASRLRFSWIDRSLKGSCWATCGLPILNPL
jgi:hypothetical protein